MTNNTARPTKILVVEDESIIAMEIGSLLTGFGYQVSELVRTGREAVALADKLRPDLILMDISLEGDMDGIQAANEITAGGYDIPIVYLTANADDHTFKRAKISEPFGYLPKPFEARLLHSTIEIAIYKSQAEKERKKLIAELRAALAKVKLLSGMLPICAACKKIRDDQGYWNQIESFIREHSEAEFSHGICPDCAQRLYPDIKLYD